MVGDPGSDLWDPFIGFRGRSCKKSCNLWDPEYRWRIIGSAWGAGRYENPMGIICRSPIPGGVIESTVTEYVLDGNNTRFLEFSGEVAGALTPTTRLGVWGLGSFLEMQGTGNIDARVEQSDNFVAQPGTADVADSRYYRSRVAFGLLFGILF